MESVYDVATYFLNKEPMTHKKLQKLCYYAQAWYLANCNEPLFLNTFEAWVHGPVSPDLYYRYRDWGWLPIAQPETAELPKFSSDRTQSFLDLVYNIYGSYSGDQLEAITHKELPWQKARKGYSPSAYCRNPISEEDMKTYYRERLGK